MKFLSAFLFMLSSSIVQADQAAITHVKIECSWGKLTMEMSQNDGSSLAALVSEATENGHAPTNGPRIGLASAMAQGKLQETCMMLEDLLYERV
ncbi:hypothetical protein [Methylomarinum vadi]|uniref:hypothetical protein n=1 Tax=Methylomarinum vadi TaxID=438855 RepID=UPI0004DEECF6|nr:hypothetical protein [Methylomarinum vadi]